jgi:hypothetical protein
MRLTKEEKIALVTNLMNDVRDALITKADQWPEDWDGHELRWLIREAISWETDRGVGDRRRYSTFHNDFITRNLY